VPVFKKQAQYFYIYQKQIIMRAITTKTFLSIIAGILVISSSCSSSKKVAIAQRDDIKGNWVLNKISYEGLDAGERLKFTLLDEGTETCITGSIWALPNNGYGSYIISTSQSGCVPGEKNIIWSYRKENGQAIVQYKKLLGGVKAKDIDEGYKFRVLSANGNTMTWQSEISYQGSTILINYDFYKK
jgi:hypothetical protein